MEEMTKALVGYYIKASEPEYKDVEDNVKSDTWYCSCSEDDHYILQEQLGCECSCHKEESK
jgi:hypothetical protein